jgi:CheY-specific phosphatase CheX
VTKTELRHALEECTATVLEKMFFVQPVDAGAPAFAGSDSDLICAVEFGGDPSGRLALRVSIGAARSIAADFLGEDEGAISGFQVGQVICELANIICGSVLSRIEGGTTFRLDSPRLLSTWKSSCADATVHSVVLETGVLAVEFSTERPVCPAGV